MRKINNIAFIKFHLNNYGGKVYRKNEALSGYDSKLHPEMKNSGQKAFGYFKDICNDINKKISNTKKIQFNQWQNSGNMLDYFWCQYKEEQRIDSASSISFFAMASYFYLCIEWDSKKDASSTNTLDQHKFFIDKIGDWVKFKNIDISQYIIESVNLDKSEMDKEYSLQDYLDKKVLIEKNNNSWIRIGKKLTNEDEKELIDIVTNMINDLEYLYKFTQTIEGKVASNKSTIENNTDGQSINDEITTMKKIEKIKKYIDSKRFIYTYEDLGNFFLSLKTKPFMILAGISGTGKSKIVRLFAEAIGANVNNGRYKMISVKPDWNDSTELFGYKNINDEFIPGQLTEIIKEAVGNRNKPYFVCIDEMNLARVEYYLSEYLSLIESRNVQENEIVTDYIFSSSYVNNNYSKLYIPENLYIIGTVNMDDTTFQFSRKVLDRANTIEFSEVDLNKLFLNIEGINEATLENVSNDFIKTSYLNINDIEDQYREYAASVNTKIVSINNILKKTKKHFAYRVRDEIIFYMVENKKLELMDESLAFDYQIMQKILPPISGSEAVIKDILIDLFNFCLGKEAVFSDTSYLEDAESFLKGAIYGKSASKILDMLRGYKYDGFATYWF